MGHAAFGNGFARQVAVAVPGPGGSGEAATTVVSPGFPSTHIEGVGGGDAILNGGLEAVGEVVGIDDRSGAVRMGDLCATTALIDGVAGGLGQRIAAAGRNAIAVVGPARFADGGFDGRGQVVRGIDGLGATASGFCGSGGVVVGVVGGGGGFVAVDCAADQPLPFVPIALDLTTFGIALFGHITHAVAGVSGDHRQRPVVRGDEVPRVVFPTFFGTARIGAEQGVAGRVVFQRFNPQTGMGGGQPAVVPVVGVFGTMPFTVGLFLEVARFVVTEFGVQGEMIRRNIGE